MPDPGLAPDLADPNLRSMLDGESSLNPRTRSLLHHYLAAEEPVADISREEFAAKLATVLADPKQVVILQEPRMFETVTDLIAEERMRHLSLFLGALYGPGAQALAVS